MSPKDPAITIVGGHELSAGDIAKLQASYGCEGTAHSGCGGYRTGEGGNITAGVEGRCDWLVTVQTGHAVELVVNNFSVGHKVILTYCCTNMYRLPVQPLWPCMMEPLLVGSAWETSVTPTLPQSSTHWTPASSSPFHRLCLHHIFLQHGGRFQVKIVPTKHVFPNTADSDMLHHHQAELQVNPGQDVQVIAEEDIHLQKGRHRQQQASL